MMQMLETWLPSYCLVWVLGLKTPTHCTILDCSWQKLTVKQHLSPPVSKFGQFQKFRTKFSQSDLCYELSLQTNHSQYCMELQMNEGQTLLIVLLHFQSSRAVQNGWFDFMMSLLFFYSPTFSFIAPSKLILYSLTQIWDQDCIRPSCTVWHVMNLQDCQFHTVCRGLKPTSLQAFRKMTRPIKSVLNWLTITIVLYAKCWHFDM